MADVATTTLTVAGNTPSTDAPNSAVGKVTYDATIIVAAQFLLVTTGFKPKYVRFENATDSISVEWYEGMADDTCIKTALNGARTLETTNQGITVHNNGFRVSQNATLAVIAASKVCYWQATA